MHAVHGSLGIPVKGFFIACILSLLVVHFFFQNEKIKSEYLLLPLLLVVCGSIGSTVSQSSFQFIQCLSLAVVVFSLNINTGKICTDLGGKIITNMAFVCLIFAVVGYIYAFLGGEPIFSVLNEETALQLPFYLTTFTNSIYGNIIRPASFFDEPGALAMFGIMAAGINEIYGGKAWKTIALLLLSNITFSLMVPIAIISYVIFNYRVFLSYRCIKYLFLILFILLVFYITNYEAINFLLIDRLTMVDGRLSGDNRMTQVYTFLENINAEIFFNGSHALGLEDGGGGVANPFTILYDSGFFVWIPYAFLIFLLLFKSIKGAQRFKFPALILALLLLQRPYLYSLYWSIFISYYLLSLVNKNSDYHIKKYSQDLVYKTGFYD